MNPRLPFFFGCLAVLWLGACASSPEPVASVPVASAGAGLSEADYKGVVKQLSTKMIAKGLPSPFVVALGPINTRESPFTIKPNKLQDLFEEALGGAGLTFSIIDFVHADSARRQLYETIEHNWFTHQSVDAEHLKRFGEMVNVDGMLFGSFSSQIDALEGGDTKVTHSFVWRLGNIHTGVLETAATRAEVTNVIKAHSR